MQYGRILLYLFLPSICFLTNLHAGGIDSTEVYDRNGKYSYNSFLGSGSGTWDFQQNKKQIKRHGVSGQPSVVLTILKLKEKSFWYTFSDGGSEFVFHLIPK